MAGDERGLKTEDTVRDIEYGRDVNLSNLQAVAAVLELKCDFVDVRLAVESCSPSEQARGGRVILLTSV